MGCLFHWHFPLLSPEIQGWTPLWLQKPWVTRPVPGPAAKARLATPAFRESLRTLLWSCILLPFLPPFPSLGLVCLSCCDFMFCLLLLDHRGLRPFLEIRTIRDQGFKFGQALACGNVEWENQSPEGDRPGWDDFSLVPEFHP